VLLNILLSHSRSIQNDTVTCVSQYFNDTMSVCRTVSEIFSVKVWRDLETGGRGRSRSLRMAPFDNNNNNNITIYKAHNVRKKLNLRRLSIGPPL